MSNAVYIDNCCTCAACEHQIQQVIISRPAQDVIDYLNCYAVSGGACGSIPSSDETALRNCIDVIWPELLAIDFDSPPIPWPDPNACSQLIYRQWGYDPASGYVEEWQSNTGLAYVETVDDPLSSISFGYIPAGGVSCETFTIITGGPTWNGNQITAVRNRIKYTGSLCLSTRECDTNDIGLCGVTGDPITSIPACGSVSDTGGFIYSTHDPAFNPQDIVFTADGSPSPPSRFLLSSLYEIIWYGNGLDGSGNPIWHTMPCVDCTCP